MVSPLIPFIATILSIVAVAIFPGKKNIMKGEVKGYRAWGKGSIYALGFIVLAVGAYLLFTMYQERQWDPIPSANMALLVVLGIGLVAGNGWTASKVKVRQREIDEEAVEVIEVVELEPVKKVKRTKAPTNKIVKVRTSKRVKRKDGRRRPKTDKATKGPVKRSKRGPGMKKKAAKTRPRPNKTVRAEPEQELIEEDEAPMESRPTASSGMLCPSCDTPIDHSDITECPVCGEAL